MWPFARKTAPVAAAPAVEEKSLAAPNEELLAALGATIEGTAAVSASVALTVPAVAAAVRVISEAAATLDIKVQRKDGTSWTDDDTHPASNLLRGAANDWLSGYEFIRDLVAEALVRNEGGLAYVNRVDGKPAELLHYRETVISVDYADTGEPTYRLSGQPVAMRDVIHLRGPFTKSPLNLAAEAIGVAHLMEKHAAKLFANGARPAGVVSFPVESKIGEDAVAKIKAGWRAAFSGASKGGETAILYQGGTYTPLSFNSVDSQFLELRKLQIDEIARAYRVPPSMIYSMDRVTWSNGEQMGREFLTYCLEPWLKALEAALTRALIEPSDRANFRIWFERDDLTRADLGSRATAYSSLISARVLSPNEARAWESLPPYDGGDAYANPNTGANQAGAAAPQPANDNRNREAA
ncbi:phage portal protein [Aquibium sp. ELW1220]|uniref:phage portal protein n=1 Tax=Aquibium sp. ELW1220 TaxID=2976766 RepID=UPI0025B09B71|nr:phage portal protein [Aquibium sp. ELW1220]MDN2582363.1 phage portal protein [Aquibium sp. ELW1220]